MTEIDEIIEKRKQAEKAIEDMPQGPMKVKAFEMIFAELLGGSDQPRQAPAGRRASPSSKKGRARKSTGSSGRVRKAAGVGAHVRDLLTDGFFKEERSLEDTVEELNVHAHKEKPKAVSTTLYRMTEKKVLKRRKRTSSDDKQIWLYKEPA